MSRKIIVECLFGHWSAWWEDEPQIAYGGATPAEAVDRLHGADLSKVQFLQIRKTV